MSELEGKRQKGTESQSVTRGKRHIQREGKEWERTASKEERENERDK